MSMMLLHAAAPHHVPHALPRKSRSLAAAGSSVCRADRRRLRRLNGLSTVLKRCATASAAAVAVEEELLGVEEENGGVDAKAVVKLHCTSLDPDWVNPWQSRTAQRSTGSGVFIRRKGDVCEILTAAHVVANTTFVQVQLAGQPDKTTARVSAVAHETDLALVEVPASLFEGIEPLDVAPGTTLPALREKVYVLGFPVGGDDLSITEGVVSRIEVQSYSHSHCRALAVTVDAAVNSGNSGGPVVSEESGLIIGVAFQGYAGSDIEGQGHMVPSPIIQRFLAAVAATRNPGLPSLGVYLQLLQSPALRARLKMRDSQTGVLVTSIEHGSCSDGVLRSGDVLLDLDGVAIANDGTCLVLGRRLALAAVLHQRYFGDKLPLTVLRDGKALKLNVELTQMPGLVPRGQYDVTPPYYLCAGLLFQPLCHEYLSTWQELKDAPPHLLVLHYDGVRSKLRTQVVMLTQILADEANVGYSGESHGMDVVTHVCGEPVGDMRNLVTALQAARASGKPFIEIDTARGDLVSRVVLDAAHIAAADARIQARYHVPSLCSHHFQDILHSSEKAAPDTEAKQPKAAATKAKASATARAKR